MNENIEVPLIKHWKELSNQMGMGESKEIRNPEDRQKGVTKKAFDYLKYQFNRDQERNSTRLQRLEAEFSDACEPIFKNTKIQSSLEKSGKEDNAFRKAYIEVIMAQQVALQAYNHKDFDRVQKITDYGESIKQFLEQYKKYEKYLNEKKEEEDYGIAGPSSNNDEHMIKGAKIYEIEDMSIEEQDFPDKGKGKEKEAFSVAAYLERYNKLNTDFTKLVNTETNEEFVQGVEECKRSCEAYLQVFEGYQQKIKEYQSNFATFQATLKKYQEENLEKHQQALEWCIREFNRLHLLIEKKMDIKAIRGRIVQKLEKVQSTALRNFKRDIQSIAEKAGYPKNNDIQENQGVLGEVKELLDTHSISLQALYIKEGKNTNYLHEIIDKYQDILYIIDQNLINGNINNKDIEEWGKCKDIVNFMKGKKVELEKKLSLSQFKEIRMLYGAVTDTILKYEEEMKKKINPKQLEAFQAHLESVKNYLNEFEQRYNLKGPSPVTEEDLMEKFKCGDLKDDMATLSDIVRRNRIFVEKKLRKNVQNLYEVVDQTIGEFGQKMREKFTQEQMIDYNDYLDKVQSRYCREVQVMDGEKKLEDTELIKDIEKLSDMLEQFGQFAEQILHNKVSILLKAIDQKIDKFKQEIPEGLTPQQKDDYDRCLGKVQVTDGGKKLENTELMKDIEKLSDMLERLEKAAARSYLQYFHDIYNIVHNTFEQYKDEISNEFTGEQLECFKKYFDEFNRYYREVPEADLIEKLKNNEIINSIKNVIDVWIQIDGCLGYLSDAEKRERNKKSLQQLPELLPILNELPEEQWWELYGNEDDYKNENKKRNPEYEKGIKELFKEKLVKIQKGDQSVTNYEEYTELYELVHKYLPDNEREIALLGNGLARDSELNFIVFGLPIRLRDRIERQQRFAAFKEMYSELINGLPLLQDWPIGVRQVDDGELLRLDVRQQLPQGIVISQITNAILRRKGLSLIMPLYSPDEGRRHVNTILKSYYEGREKPDQTRYDRLREITKTVRQLYIIHPKCDGNGRTNGYGLMNIFLLEEGFCPSLYAKNSNRCLGENTLDGFMEDVIAGMYAFVERIKQHNPSFAIVS